MNYALSPFYGGITMKRRRRRAVFLLPVLVLFAAVGVGAYFLFFNKSEPTPEFTNITYDTRGVSVSGMPSGNAETVNAGAKGALPEPSADGFTFEGWYLRADYTGKLLQRYEDLKPGDVGLHAKWTYIVTFATNGIGGLPVPVRTRTRGEAGLLPSYADVGMPVGYTLEGWYAYYDKDATDFRNDAFKDKVSDFKDILSGHTKLYAKWTYRITFNLKGEAAAGMSEYIPADGRPYEAVNGDTAALPAPQSTEHAFVGWFRDDVTFRNKVTKYGDLNGEITLYAKWGYGVIFDVGGIKSSNTYDNTVGNFTVFIEGGASGALPTARHADWIFDGWYTLNGADTGSWGTARSNYSELWQSLQTGNVRLYAKWSYEVTFETRNLATLPAGAVTRPVKGYAGGMPYLSASNRTFAGWFRDEDYTQSVSDYSALTDGKITLYAKWMFRVTFQLNGVTLDGGGAVIPGKGDYYDTFAGDASVLPSLASRSSAYQFDGWYASFTAPATYSGSVVSYADVVGGHADVYAKWRYTVTYNFNGANVSYFNGEYVSSQTTTGGTGNLTQERVKGAPGEMPTPIAADYTFGSWYRGLNGENGVFNSNYKTTDFSQLETGDIICYAEWKFTVVFHVNGAGAVANVETTKGITAALPGAPHDSSNRVFGGWYSESTFTRRVERYADFAAATVVGGQADAYARWGRLIEFDTDGIPASNNYNESFGNFTMFVGEDSAGSLPRAASPQWTFDGWYSAKGENGVWNSAMRVETVSQVSAASPRLYAKWRYNVIFTLNGLGYMLMSETTKVRGEGGALPAPANAPAAWVFADWYKDAAFNNAVTDFSNLTDGHVTLQAKWILRYETVSAGLNFTLAIDADGYLWAWGANVKGQLGLGDTVERTAPVKVSASRKFKTVSAGKEYALAVDSADNLWAWGDNSSGQLGLGETYFNTYKLVLSPVQVTNAKYKAVSAGETHSLALDANGGLWAWGASVYGQCGILQTIVFAPNHIGSGTYASVAAGKAHSLALDANGGLWAWGDNFAGQLGVGGVTVQYAVPQRVSGSYKFIAAGSDLSFALDADNRLFAWGSGSNGELGSGASLTNSSVPTEVDSGKRTYIAVAVKGGRVVALASDGSMWLWGNGVSVPTRGDTLRTYSKIAVGFGHIVAISAGNGIPWAFGSNGGGQLGLGDHTDRSTPARVEVRYAA